MPRKTAALVPEFEVEDLPLSRTATLVTEFAVKDLLLAEYSDDIIYRGLHYNKIHQILCWFFN